MTLEHLDPANMRENIFPQQNENSIAKKNHLKQPKTLYLLFFTELWERFGFYTLQAIIILYMTKALLMPDQHANLLYAAFSSLLYLTPIIGGYLADRYLGYQRAITIGGILFIIAYLVTAVNNETMFFIGLALIICANGLFKPNVSSIVGELYSENDPRRDGGFTLFYMGINVGALIPPLIAGALVATYGWHSGFVLAAAGMALGQIIFMFGKKHLGTAGLYPTSYQSEPGRIKPENPSFKFYTLLFTGIVLLVGICKIAFSHPALTNYLIEASGVGVIAIVIFYMFKEPLEQRKKLFACLILIIISVGFWSLYNQAFTSLMLFADRNMDKSFLGLTLDAENTQFFNPFFIIALSPILSRLWVKLDTKGNNPSTQLKFSIGVLCMAIGYLILAVGAYFSHHNGMTSASWLILSYFSQTIGELLVSPIGLAMITVLSPKHLVGMMMGIWFFSQAASFAIGGTLANIAAVPEHINALSSSPIYAHAFGVYGMIGLAMALVSFALIPFLNKMVKRC